MSRLNKETRDALRWFAARNGDGVLDLQDFMLAGGETARFLPGTWTRLRNANAVEFYAGRRVRITAQGRALLATWQNFLHETRRAEAIQGAIKTRRRLSR
jgi:hypothetical protein